jgi:hypothetical protein
VSLRRVGLDKIEEKIAANLQIFFRGVTAELSSQAAREIKVISSS